MASMEEPKAPEAAPQLSNPPPTTPPTQTPLPPTTTTTTKKRPLDSDSNSNYFKIRAVIQDLRPHFIQVLQTPDYKNCKASEEIREQLKIVMKLYVNMKADVKSKNTQQDGQNLDQKTVQEQQQPQQHVKTSEQSQVEKAFAKPSEIKLQGGEDSNQVQGTYRIGGSAFGWNFITFSGKDPVYYGRTKEEFRSAKVTE